MQVKAMLQYFLAVHDQELLPGVFVSAVAELRLHYSTLAAVISCEHDNQTRVVGSVKVQFRVALDFDQNHAASSIFFYSLRIMIAHTTTDQLIIKLKL